MSGLRAPPGRLGRPGGRVAALPKRAESFYLSPEWRALVASVKRQRGAWCAKCGASGRGVRIIGDHIVERRDGGADLDAGNVELLCASCHNGKTAAAKAARVNGTGGGRKSTDPDRLHRT